MCERTRVHLDCYIKNKFTVEGKMYSLIDLIKTQFVSVALEGGIIYLIGLT